MNKMNRAQQMKGEKKEKICLVSYAELRQMEQRGLRRMQAEATL